MSVVFPLVTVLLLFLSFCFHVNTAFGIVPSPAPLVGDQGEVDEKQTGFRDMFVCSALLPSTLVAYCLVHLTCSSPVVIFLAYLLGGAARASLAFSPHPVSNYGYMFILDAVLNAFAIALVVQDRKKLLVAFPPAKAREFIFYTLPSNIFSTLGLCSFLVGETCSCLTQKAYGQESQLQCRDAEGSNLTFALACVAFLGTRILILPFTETPYTLSDVIRFDLPIGAQLQIILLYFGVMLTVVIYGSQNDMQADASFPEEARWYVMTNDGRELTQLIAWALIVAYIVTACISFDVWGSGTALASFSPRLLNAGQRLRGSMRTLKRVRFAPIYRAWLAGVAFLSSLPQLLALIEACRITPVDPEPFRGSLQMSWLYGFCVVINAFAASAYIISTPSKWNTRNTVVYFTTLIMNITFTLGSVLLLNSPKRSIDIFNCSLFFVATFLLYQLLRAGVAHIAVYSQNAIECHLKRCFVVLVGTSWTLIYLSSEVAGCTLCSSSNMLGQCLKLTAANFTTALHIAMSCIVFIATSISHANVSIADVASFREIGAGYVISGGLQSISFLLAFYAFGARPKDKTSDLYNFAERGKSLDTRAAHQAEMDSSVVIEILKYVVGLIWVIILIWQTKHLRRKVRGYSEAAGLLQDDDGEGASNSVVSDLWRRVMASLNGWVKRKRVGDEEARVSPVISSIFLAIAILCSIHPWIAACLIIAHGKEEMSMFALNWTATIYHWGLDYKFVAFMTSFIYVFSDLETNDTGKWRYRDVHLFLFVFNQVLESYCSYYLADEKTIFGEFVIIAGITALAISGTFHRRKALALDRTSRRKHVYEITIPVFLAVAAPLTYLTAEMASCDLLIHRITQLKTEVMTVGGHNDYCEGLWLTTSPLLMFTCALELPKILNVGGEMSLTLENISKLDLNFESSVRLLSLAVAGVYAVVSYGLRSVHAASDFERTNFSGFCVILAVAIFAESVGKLRRVCNIKAWNEPAGKARRRKSFSNRDPIRRCGSSTVEERRIEGAHKSVWEGGTRGLTNGSNKLAPAGTRGIAQELERERKRERDSAFEGVFGRESDANDSVL
jgi:hypothetical protein